MTKKYMHTLDGKPAHFDKKNQQIFFSGRGSYNAVRLVDSVAQIHRNERASAITRKRDFGATAVVFETGWVNVMI